MHIASIASIAAVCLGSVCTAAKYSFYVDESCENRDKFADAVSEALDSAALVIERLAESEELEPDIHAIFERLFKTPTTDEAAKKKVAGKSHCLSA